MKAIESGIQLSTARIYQRTENVAIFNSLWMPFLLASAPTSTVFPRPRVLRINSTVPLSGVVAVLTPKSCVTPCTRQRISPSAPCAGLPSWSTTRTWMRGASHHTSEGTARPNALRIFSSVLSDSGAGAASCGVEDGAASGVVEGVLAGVCSEAGDGVVSAGSWAGSFGAGAFCCGDVDCGCV